MTADTLTSLFPLLGQAAFGAINGPIPGGNEVTAAQNALLIPAGHTHDLFLQFRCHRQDSIPEPDTLQRVVVPLGAAWVDSVIQRTAISIVEITAVVADQTSHLSELKIIEPGQLTHAQTPACSPPYPPCPP